MDYLLIPDSGFAISIFLLAIIISGLAIMILFLAQAIFLKKQGETDNVLFLPEFATCFPPLSPYSSVFRESGEIDE